MKKSFRLILVLMVVVAVPLLYAAGDAAAGKVVYTKKCGTCHGPNGEPKPAIAKMMKVEMRHLGAKEVQTHSDAELIKIMKEGSGKMKPVTGLTEKDLSDLVAFVRTLQVK